MFDGCKSLTSLDLSMFNTDNVTIMREMFRTCSALKTILCNEDWSKSKLLTSSDNMFDGCTSLVGGNGTKYDANHTNIAYARPDGEDGKPGYFFKKQTEVYTAFNAATGILTYYYNDQRAARTAAGEITELYDPVNNPDALDYRWGEYHLQITKIKVDVSMKDAHLTSTYCMFCQGFSGLTNMTEIEGIENLVTDEVKDMKCMFMNCTALTSLNLSSFNTANVTDMFGMFAQCFALTSLDVSKFNTANVTDMTGMFNACKSLTSLDLSMFNTDNVTGMRDMFRTCSVLKTILCNEDWSKSEVLTNSNNMFRDCNSLVGGSGTKYDANHFGIEYARPDGEDGKPGYFTSNAQLKPLPNDETTTFDFSLIDNQTNQELLGITLGAKDEYNATEGCMQISTTNTEEEIDAKLNAAFAGAASFKSLLPGTITFRLNAGQGSIIIDCRTNPGYTLVVRIAEYGTAYISSTKEQVERGKATVNYNVTQDTYVVIYLESSPSASTPARIAKSDEDEEAGAYIYSIQIKPVSTGLETTENDSRDTRKLLINGHLYILRDGRLHTVTGMEMR
jgi:surface protein